MKHLISFLLLIGSLNVFATPARDFCVYDIHRSSNRGECFRIIQGGHFNNSALNGCAEITSDGGKLECLNIIKNKDYTRRTARYCKSPEFTGDEMLDCFEDNGSYSNHRRSNRRAQLSSYDYDRDEYLTCYERPKTRLVEVTNHAQNESGTKKVIGGLLGILGGQVLGEVTGNEKLGNAISIAGAAVAVIGSVEVASSQDIIYADNGYDCRSFYTMDRRVYTRTVQSQTCTTRRYYTQRWGSTHEYFETTCNSRTYMSFERNRHNWYRN